MKIKLLILLLVAVLNLSFIIFLYVMIVADSLACEVSTCGMPAFAVVFTIPFTGLATLVPGLVANSYLKSLNTTAEDNKSAGLIKKLSFVSGCLLAGFIIIPLVLGIIKDI